VSLVRNPDFWIKYWTADFLLIKGGRINLIYPSLDELLKNVDSRYTLVTAAAKRARKILEESRQDEEKTIKAVSLALEEIGTQKLKIEHTKTGIK
jgi:DNA-directed RNA polymerase subunit omega